MGAWWAELDGLPPGAREQARAVFGAAAALLAEVSQSTPDIEAVQRQTQRWLRCPESARGRFIEALRRCGAEALGAGRRREARAFVRLAEVFALLNGAAAGASTAPPIAKK